jgi:integrase
MISIARPRFGDCFRIRGNGYVEGIFVVDGVRKFRNLAKMCEVERNGSGRTRTEKQVNDAIQALWEDRRKVLEEELRNGYVGPDSRIADAFDEWIAKAPGNGVAPVTVERHYRGLVREYLAGVGDHGLRDVSLAHVDRLKAHLHARGLAPVTINMHLTRMATFLNWAARRGYVKNSPRVEKLRLKKRVARVPQQVHIQALARRMHERATAHPNRKTRYQYELHWMLLLFVLGTGVRRGGPFYAKWEHVYLDEAAMLLEKSKGGEELIFLPEVLVSYLRGRRERYPHHVWLFDNGKGELAYSEPHALTTAFRRHLHALGFGDLDFKPIHGFRANFATVSLNELGVDSRTVAKLLDHASFRTTEESYLADRAKEKRRGLALYEQAYLHSVLDEDLRRDGFRKNGDGEDER